MPAFVVNRRTGRFRRLRTSLGLPRGWWLYVLLLGVAMLSGCGMDARVVSTGRGGVGHSRAAVYPFSI